MPLPLASSSTTLNLHEVDYPAPEKHTTILKSARRGGRLYRKNGALITEVILNAGYLNRSNMSRKRFVAWLSSAACLLIAGCGGASFSLLFFDEFPHDQVHPLAFQKVLPALDSAIGERRLVVVRDLVAWEVLWREHTAGLIPQPPMPSINFSQNMVIAIFSGARNNPCINIEIQSIWQHSHPGRIEVNYRELPFLPNAQGQCTPGFRTKAVLVTLQYSFLPVEFFRID